MKKRLESPTRREIPMEERRNRPRGEFWGGGGGLERVESVLGLKAPPATGFYMPSAGAGRPDTGGRATRLPPEVPRATRAPLSIDPAGPRVWDRVTPKIPSLKKC
jgi:hypothetical protein